MVIIEKGIVYIGGSDFIFCVICIKNGKVVWIYIGIKGYIEIKFLVEGDKVIFGVWDNIFYVFNKFNGKEFWKWIGGLICMYFFFVVVWFVVVYGKVFIIDL